jgi:transcriptional antiterminator RfaH
MEKWYTLHTKPNAEYQVTAVLQQHGFETYLPEVETPTTDNGTKLKPFFPCYLFSKIDLKAVGISRVQWTPGLRRIVSFDNEPVPMPDDVIEAVRRKLQAYEAGGGWMGHDFDPGDPVLITDGPFRDMLAVFDGPIEPSERVQVLLDILGRASRVQIDVTDLQAAPSDSDEPAPKRQRRTRGKGRRIDNT